jgi:hypothetical protein
VPNSGMKPVVKRNVLSPLTVHTFQPSADMVHNARVVAG